MKGISYDTIVLKSEIILAGQDTLESGNSGQK